MNFIKILFITIPFIIIMGFFSFVLFFNGDSIINNFLNYTRSLYYYNYINLFIIGVHFVVGCMTIYFFGFTGGDGLLESHLEKHSWAGKVSITYFLVQLSNGSWESIFMAFLVMFGECITWKNAHKGSYNMENGFFIHLDFDVIGNLAIVFVLLISMVFNKSPSVILDLILYFPIIFISVGTPINATVGLGLTCDGDFINILQKHKSSATTLVLKIGITIPLILSTMGQLLGENAVYYFLFDFVILFISTILLATEKGMRANRHKNVNMDKFLELFKKHNQFVAGNEV